MACVKDANLVNMWSSIIQYNVVTFLLSISVESKFPGSGQLAWGSINQYGQCHHKLLDMRSWGKLPRVPTSAELSADLTCFQ